MPTTKIDKQAFKFLRHVEPCEAFWNIGRRAAVEPLIPCKCGLDKWLTSVGLLDAYNEYGEARRQRVLKGWGLDR